MNVIKSFIVWPSLWQITENKSENFYLLNKDYINCKTQLFCQVYFGGISFFFLIVLFSADH